MKPEENVIWCYWECPVCGDENQDPTTIWETTCSNGHNVAIYPMIDGGYADAEELNLDQ